MKLPNASSAVVEPEKITEYLLNPAHPDNGGKAAFFFSLGFQKDNWQTLASALRKMSEAVEITKSMETSHGCKYIADGRIETPAGKSPMVRVIWIVDQGFDSPRVVTAYPK